MLTSVPLSVQQDVLLKLHQRIGSETALYRFSFSSGGCINNGGKLETSVGNFFLKWNDAVRFPGMFEAEAKGLTLLQQAKAVHIPDVVAFDEVGGSQYLLLSYTDESLKTSNYWERLGESLAHLHQGTNQFYGLDNDNYIGSLPQSNIRSSSWVDFFIQQRLSPQLQIACNQNKVDHRTQKRFDLLYQRLPSLLCVEEPSLLHGDLWSGNVMVNEVGAPSLIDPAVYYGHREVDLAMTTLFGGFGDWFYEAYKATYPLEQGWKERLQIYNLYPLLVHVNLFGGSYLHQVSSTLNMFL